MSTTIREAPAAPVVGLHYRAPGTADQRAVVLLVDAIIDTPEGRQYVTGRNALGQHFTREVTR